jgi:hypothetical protein
VLAADVRPRQLEVLAQEVGQALPRLDEALDGFAVDAQTDHVPVGRHRAIDATRPRVR